MEKLQAAVLEFATAAGTTIRSVPTVPGFEECRTMLALMQEEAVIEFGQALIDKDPVAAADALTDTVYICMHNACRMGIDLGKVFDLIHANNMEKRWEDGEFHTNEKGKIVKPPGFAHVDLSKHDIAIGE